MRIKVKLYGTMLRKNPPNGELDVPNDCTLLDLLKKLGVSEEEAAVAIMNGNHVKLHDQLQDGAEVSIFNGIFGG